MRTSAPVPDPTKPTRLPVNPRRSHVSDGQRKRVKTACNSCNTRRVRCSGDQPCLQCKNAGRDCVYPPADKKVSIAQSERDELRTSKAILERCLREAIPDPTQRRELMAKQARLIEEATGTSAHVKDDEPNTTSPTPSNSTTTALSPGHDMYQMHYEQSGHLHRLNASIDTAATEGSLLQDRDGTKRWLGGTSGATFLDHLKKFMNTLKSSLGYMDSPSETTPGFTFLASRGQYQTSDSRLLSLPTNDSIQTFATQINWNDAVALLSKAENLLHGSITGFICGGIHYFGDFSPQTWSQVQADPTRVREQAFYEAAFALGTVYSLTAANSRRDGQLGEMFFAKARKILGDCNDISRYSIRDVPTLALMAIYMTEMNRRDNSYMYLSSAMTICCMFGGLNGRLGDERDIRVVWTLFCMTRDASYVMGRPPIYPDEAFRLPQPSDAPGLPSPEGLKAHIELSRIAGYIVTETYQISPRNGEDIFPDTVARVVEAMVRLDGWRDRIHESLLIPLELPPEPQIPLDDAPSDEYLPTDRALCMLHMKWNQLRILALRPLFFLAVKASVGGDFINAPLDMFDHKIDPGLLVECSAAARRNLRLGRHLYARCMQVINRDGTHDRGKLVMMDLHHIFNAAVILLLHQMVYSNVVNTDTNAILAARRIFENEARTECASPGSKTGSGSKSGNGMATGYASDCLGVLNGLAALVALIRPLRFKGSDHVNIEVNADFGSPIPMDVVGGSSNGGSGDSSSSHQHNNMALSEEQLAANLGLENPYRPSDETWHDNHLMIQDGETYTNQKEMERWVQECREGLSGPFLRYTGM